MFRSLGRGCVVSLLFAGFVSQSILANDGDRTDQVSEEPKGELIVHEWGTFTTFSGSDGVFLDFRPLANEVSDLPPFVMDRANQSPLSVLSKKRLRGRVRMETPVTYFYTDRVRDVNVSVGFPKGLLTEFYPPVKEMLPKFDARRAYGDGEVLGNSKLDWGTVTLIPIDTLAPKVENSSLRDRLTRHLARAAVPADQAGGHYGQARATDSALVAVQRPNSLWSGVGDEIFVEKFLFYRGVGQFDLPLKAAFGDDESLKLTNVSSDPISSAIRIDVRGEQIHVTEFERINAGDEVAASAPVAMGLPQLSERVVELLVNEGLYEKEARSMVETWKKSWFAEPGSRVLYMVPPRITDELLPLKVTPVPDKTLRVLVGRLELMTPGMEKKMINAVRVSQKTRAVFESAKKDKNVSFPIPDQIRAMGRMTEPGLVRVSKLASDGQVRREAEKLISQLRAE